MKRFGKGKSEQAYVISWDKQLNQAPVLSVKASSVHEAEYVRSAAVRYGVKLADDSSACRELQDAEESLEIPESCYRTIARLFVISGVD